MVGYCTFSHKYPKASKFHYWFKSDSDLAQLGDFAYWCSCIGKSLCLLSFWTTNPKQPIDIYFMDKTEFLSPSWKVCWIKTIWPLSTQKQETEILHTWEKASVDQCQKNPASRAKFAEKKREKNYGDFTPFISKRFLERLYNRVGKHNLLMLIV